MRLSVVSRIATLCVIGSSFLASVPHRSEAAPVLSGDCALSWNANQEPDLAGYRLHLGRLASQLTLVTDLGNRTTVRCSEVQAAANGRWFAAITAYDRSGNESARSPILPFELAGIPERASSTPLLEPILFTLTVRVPGVQLLWADRNQPMVSHRVEVSSSLHPSWSTVTVEPPGMTRLATFQLSEAEWVCYRVRAEQGALVSGWARLGGDDDRQLCYRPARVASVEQPIVAPTVLFEPEGIRLIPKRAGFDLAWTPPLNAPTASYRIEASSSVQPSWTSLAVMPPTVNRFSYGLPLDADWACLRIRAEVGRFVSLWAMGNGPQDRQHCFVPGL